VSFANPACFAAKTWECVKKMSGEHPMSRKVLKALSRVKKSVAITGHGWQDVPRKTVGIESLTARCLCKRHNEMFSDLDTQMGTLTGWLSDVDHVFAPGTVPTNRVQGFNGHNVERWMLKALCGGIKAGHYRHLGLDGDPSAQWLRVISGKSHLRAPLGLYLDQGAHGTKIDAQRSIYVKPLTGQILGQSRPVVIGGRVSMFGIRFVLMLHDPQRLVHAGSVPQWIYRPRALRWYSPSSTADFSDSLRMACPCNDVAPDSGL
jgi:hypothetical protein